MRAAIGRYRVLGQLGEGGTGLVYDAWDDRLERPGAVKVMRPGTHGSHGGGDPVVRRRRESAAGDC
jgi:serine/threonine protein kinase